MSWRFNWSMEARTSNKTGINDKIIAILQRRLPRILRPSKYWYVTIRTTNNNKNGTHNSGNGSRRGLVLRIKIGRLIYKTARSAKCRRRRKIFMSLLYLWPWKVPHRLVCGTYLEWWLARCQDGKSAQNKLFNSSYRLWLWLTALAAVRQFERYRANPLFL